MIVRFAELCDVCGSRSAEYTQQDAECTQCGKALCESCMAPGTFVEGEDGARPDAMCVKCYEGPDVCRPSSVDSLLPSPGYDAITLAELWQIADKASGVIAAAQGHVGYDNEHLDRAFQELMAVCFYTCDLRATSGAR